jgi:DNA-binding CsgD family transcriptional regulator
MPGGALVGRDRELGTILDLLRRDGGALLLHGDAGAGKTALLAAATEIAAASGTPVLRTDGIEGETGLTYASLHRLLEPILPWSGRLSRPERRVLLTALGLDHGPPPQRLAVTTAVLTLLAHARGDGALLVVVDDLPWLDRMSAAVLAFVARRLTGSRIALLGASRTGETSFFDDGGLPVLAVAALDDDSAATLVDRSFPLLAPRRRRQVLDQAAGNPLALLTLPTLTGSRHDTAAPTDRLFAGRLAPLPPQTRRTLLLAALDTTGDLGVLQAASGGDAIDDLAPAELAGLIAIDAESRRIVFRHPLMRSAVLAMSSAERRRDLHAALAAHLPDQPDRRAWHLATAATAADEPIAAQLEQAADRTLRRGDPVGAVATLLRAADLTPPGRQRSRRLARAAFLGAEITGDIGIVPGLLAGSSPPGDILDAAVATSAFLLNGEGDLDAAYRLLLSALTDRPALDGDDPTTVDALWFLIAICAFGGSADRWQPLGHLFDRCDPPAPRYLTVVARTFGDPAYQALPVLTELDEMIGRLNREPDPARVARIAIAGAYVDRLHDDRPWMIEVLQHGRSGGAITSQIQIGVIVANDSFHGGQWDEALDLCTEGDELCTTHGYQLLRWLYVHQGAVIAAARGHHDRARAAADDMTRWAAPRGVELLLRYAHGIRALALLGQGDFHGAFTHATAITPAGRIQPYVPYALWTAQDLVESAVRAGLRNEAARHVAVLQELNIPQMSPRRAMVVSGAAGMVAADRYADHFEAALAVDGAGRWPFEQARIQLFYGRRLRHDRRTGDARRHLGDAYDTFRRLGATPWSGLATRELRAIGAPSPAARGTAVALTPHQREVVRLAAAGLSNKQIAERLFLSPRTVATHLYQAFPKLGVTSRAALRDALEQEPDVT